MAFIQPCFIRNNTSELMKKLEELGYFYTYYHDGNGIYCYNNIAQTFTYNNEIPKECIGISKNNEGLFLALAALRDDTDINQIYLWNERHLVKCIRDYSCTLNIEATPYYMCQLINNSDIKFEIPCKELRKATVKEIIEHFK